MNTRELIKQLEICWGVDGFLDHVRQGNFEVGAGNRFLMMLNSIDIADDEMIPKRLLSLLWYLPTFLEWQKERVAEVGHDATGYTRFTNEVQNMMERVLGVP